ncbi:MAG: hypothetical protein ACRC7S_13975 [Cetobacterium sp.]
MRVYYIKVAGRFAQVTDCYDVHSGDVYWYIRKYGACRVNYGDVEMSFSEYRDAEFEAMINKL